MKHHFQRMLALILAVCLALSVCALAESEAAVEPSAESLDNQAAQITQMVKDRLSLNTDAYTQFYSDSYTLPNGTMWNLDWYGDSSSLNISLTNDTVTGYYQYADSETNSLFYGFSTVFPNHTLAEGKAAAEDFLAKILREEEDARFTSERLQFNSLESYFRFNGVIRKNGLDTPVTFSMRVNADDLSVTRFSRTDDSSGYLGEPDSPSAAVVDSSSARQTLRSSVSMELIWVLNDDTGLAELQYIPRTGNFAVDAKTGDLVDLDALYENLDTWNYNFAADMAGATEEAPAEGESGLTKAEQQNIANLKDVRTAADLDAMLRSISALGLTDGFSMTSHYSTNQQTGQVTCRLRYTCPITADNTFGANPDEIAAYADTGSSPFYVVNVTVDAKTGELQRINAWSYIDGFDEASLQDSAALCTIAQDFLSQYGKEQVAAMQLYEQADDSFTFAQLQDGYFFPENAACITLNPVTGTIMNLSYQTPKTDVRFGSSEDPISMDSAIDAYMQAGETELCYVAWPIAVDAADEELAAYAEYGFSYIERLALVYVQSFGQAEVSSVNAITGEVLRSEPSSASIPVYTDLDGCYGKAAIEALAQVGIGFADESFRPNDTITQRELISLVLSANSGSIINQDDSSLKSEAIYLGLISSADWNPDAKLSRMQVLRCILNASEYGKAAALSGAYLCSFSDESGIKPSDYGYASIGQALGVVQGDTSGYFNAYGSCSRQDAAIMIYNFLNR